MSYPVPLNNLADYETQMVHWGDIHGPIYTDNTQSFNDQLLATYYDAIWVYDRIYHYTNLPRFLNYSHGARTIYRDDYVLATVGYGGAVGAIPGYWNFTHGETAEAQEESDTTSANAVFDQSRNAAFNPETTPLSSTQSWAYSREVAYAIMAELNARKCGFPARTQRLTDLVNQAIGHLDQWFVSQTADYVRAFMVSLTCHALASVNETPGLADARIVPYIIKAHDYLWSVMWLPLDKCFMYTDRTAADGSGGQEAAPDLNLLILPAIWGYLYFKTGDTKYITEGDQIFSGGVVGAGTANNMSGAFLAGSGKQFNQNYRISFDYIIYREGTPQTTPPAPTPSPSPGPVQPSTSVISFPILFPVVLETWQQHFVNNGWTTPQAQVSAGYPLYCLPSAPISQFIETVDIGAIEASTATIVLTYNVQTPSGTVTVTPSLSVSPDNVTFTDFPGQANILASNFRYIKVKLDAVAKDKKSIAVIPEARVIVTLKTIRDGGNGTYHSSDSYTDSGGAHANVTPVTLNKAFSQIDSINVSGLYQSGTPNIKTDYIWVSVPNPTQFGVIMINTTTGLPITSGAFSWQVTGK